MCDQTMLSDAADRIVGCVVGGAIGDAFGAAYEGRSPPVSIDDSSPWILTDDTQLTLATCEAIIAANGKVEPAEIAARFAEWFRHGRVTGIGASTYKALSELSVGGHWALVGAKGERAAGNGAAMRIAPLAFCSPPDRPMLRREVRDVSRITHHNEEAYAGALAVVVAVSIAFDSGSTGGRGLLAEAARALPDCIVRDRLREIDAAESALSVNEIAARFGCSGWVVESVPLAIVGAERVRRIGFTGMLRELVHCGGDTDTVASIAGQVAGTLVGYSELPAEMLVRLPDRERIVEVARLFAETVGAGNHPEIGYNGH